MVIPVMQMDAPMSDHTSVPASFRSNNGRETNLLFSKGCPSVAMKRDEGASSAPQCGLSKLGKKPKRQ